MQFIVFNDLAVQLTLQGKKTQVRKLLKFPQISENTCITHDSIVYHAPSATFEGFYPEDWLFVIDHSDPFSSAFTVQVECPYKVGEIVSVKEPWNYGYVASSDSPENLDSWFEPSDIHSTGYLGQLSSYFYKADDLNFFDEVNLTWKSATSMPRIASRLFLKITAIHAERLQDMKLSDVKKEGFLHRSKQYFGEYYWNRHLSSVYKSLYNWDANPFVWVIDYEIDHVADI